MRAVRIPQTGVHLRPESAPAEAQDGRRGQKGLAEPQEEVGSRPSYDTSYLFLRHTVPIQHEEVPLARISPTYPHVACRCLRLIPTRRSVDAEPPPLALQNSTIAQTAPSPPPPPVSRPNHNLAQLGETLGLQRRQHSRYIGLTSPFDSLLIGLSQFDTRNEATFDLGTLRRVNDHECFIMLPDENTQDYAEDVESLRLVEQIVHPHGPQLLELYFHIVHPNFPIIQKRLFVERYRNGDHTFAPALIAGMYLLALNWWSFDHKLANFQKPDAARLEAIAMKSLRLAMERPKLSTIQAGLILLQRPEAASWSLTTQLVAIGQELGLHLDCSGWSIPLWERGLRKRIAWALYLQDKWTSLIHGRPSHIFSANWAVQLITKDDFYEEADGYPMPLDETQEDKEENERGQVLYAQMISLTEIMAEVMDTFYTQTAIQDFANAGKGSTQLILMRAKNVQLKLRKWHEELPACVKMTAPTTNGRLCATGYLHLAYFATEITLHRRIVQSLSPIDPSSSSPSYATFMIRNAAKTRLISAMEFVNRLQAEHLRAFWYFASKINFTLIGTFGSLLYATSPAQEEAAFYEARLREYRWTLSVSAKRAGEWLEQAVRMLDAGRALLGSVGEKPRFGDMVQVGSQQQASDQGQAQFDGQQHPQVQFDLPGETRYDQHAPMQQQQQGQYEGDTPTSMVPPERRENGDVVISEESLMARTESTGSWNTMGHENGGLDMYRSQGHSSVPGSSSGLATAEGSTMGDTPMSQQ